MTPKPSKRFVPIQCFLLVIYVLLGENGKEERVTMAFTELELKLIENTVGKMCRRRSPVHLRDEIRLAHDVAKYFVEVYEERPGWKNRNHWTRMGIARFRYGRRTERWHLYWMRQDLKWHLYEPLSESRSLEKLVAEVDRDPHGAFFG